MTVNDRLNIADGENLKYRNEIKYIVTEGELAILEGRLSALMRRDAHVNEDGIYRIRSAYFDDSYNNCFFENENGTDRREKFRVRIYNADEGRITLECKYKERQKTRKESVSITRQMYESMVDGTFRFTPELKESPLLSRFAVRYEKDELRPVIIVAYERTPFVFSAGNVRITFDRNIGFSSDVGALFDPYLPLRPVMPAGRHILEVKYDKLMPNVLHSAANLRDLRQETYSKYYICRNFSILNK